MSFPSAGDSEIDAMGRLARITDDSARRRRWMTEHRDFQLMGHDHGSQLIQLIINQDTTAQEWMKLEYRPRYLAASTAPA